MAGLLFPSQPSTTEITAQQPAAPASNDAAQQEAAREERLADSKAVGRSSTILTDYALATQQPSTLKPTLGA